MLEHVKLDFEKRSRREDWEQDNGIRGKGGGGVGGGGVGLENTLQEIFKNNKRIIMNIDD